MPSNAFNIHLTQLLIDAEELSETIDDLRTIGPLPVVRAQALNRAVVVLCVSAWEAYIEQVTREALEAIRPPGPPMGVWPALNATARAAIGRFNTPNTDQVRTLISDAIGFPDVQLVWSWQKCSDVQARQRLHQAMELRHQIAHGVNPRPVIPNQYASLLPLFFRKLGKCTDAAIRQHLVATLGIANPWPM